MASQERELTRNELFDAQFKEMGNRILEFHALAFVLCLTVMTAVAGIATIVDKDTTDKSSVSYLVQYFGWNPVLLIVVGGIASVVIFAYMFRPTKKYAKVQEPSQ